MSGAAVSPGENVSPDLPAVVLRCGDRIVKGRLESPHWSVSDHALPSSPGPVCDLFRIRILGSDMVEEIPASEVSVVFFVNDFHGDPERHSVRFHAQEPALPGVWIQVQLPSGEVIEGIVENSLRFLADPGFFLRPTDPGSNNRLVYLMKGALVDLHVLGLTRI